MTAIEIENLSKQYTLGTIGSGTLWRDMNVWWAQMRGKTNPYQKIGQINDRTQKADGDYVWALRDICLKIEEGDVVGIIGSNGAGKSTLLKILSRVTTPTTGCITTYGRIASLLEVGTGFHQEMTGRENIYMNGAIMGMTRAEITRKLDEIVDFAGVAKYIDTPVKRYSSGMTVRLGFAVAAFLEPEILVVDEVLAVGDAEFQKKAIGKMKEVSQGQGRTVLFVSHNMDAVQNLCTSGIVLQKGQISMLGPVEDCISRYLSNNKPDYKKYVKIEDAYRKWQESRELELVDAFLHNNPSSVATDEDLSITLTLRCNNHDIKEYNISVMIYNDREVRLINYCSSSIPVPSSKDYIKEEITLKNHGLTLGNYSIGFAIGRKDYSANNYNYDSAFNVLYFSIRFLTSIPLTSYWKWDNSWGNILYQDRNIEITSCN